MTPVIIGIIIGVVLFSLGAAYNRGKDDGAAVGAAAEKARLLALAEAEEGAQHAPAGPKTSKSKPKAPKLSKLQPEDEGSWSADPEQPYKVKGDKMPKPVFLPTPADSTLEEDPVIPWEPVKLTDDEGVINWDNTEANAVFLNPKTGEFVEFGSKWGPGGKA